MPIRPENRDKYPKDWGAIRAEVLDRAGNCCERCGVENGTWREACTPKRRPGQVMVGRGLVKIILTIAHLDHDPTNNGREGERGNLEALCQRCHNRHDAAHRGESRRIRRLLAAGKETPRTGGCQAGELDRRCEPSE